MNEMDSLELIKKGDKDAFASYINNNQIYFYSIAINYLKNDDYVKDAIGNMICNSYENIHKLRNIEYLKTWLTKILINECKKIIDDSMEENEYIISARCDVEYLKRSMKLYEKYNIPCVGYRIDEKDMPCKVNELLLEHRPDILIVTGHDAIDKNGNNINSNYFVECVKKARVYQPSKDSLCIIAGACFSSFKELINLCLIQWCSNLGMILAKYCMEELDGIEFDYEKHRKR